MGNTIFWAYTQEWHGWIKWKINFQLSEELPQSSTVSTPVCTPTSSGLEFPISTPYQHLLLVFWSLSFLPCVLICGQFWKSFHGLWGRKWVLCCLGGMVWRYQLGLFDLWRDSTPGFLYAVFIRLTSLLVTMWCWSHPLIVCLSQCMTLGLTESLLRDWVPLCVCVCGAYIFRTVMSSWCIFLLMSRNWPSLCLLSSFSLKSILLEEPQQKLLQPRWPVS